MGLNFLEALQALKEGKCVGIRLSWWVGDKAYLVLSDTRHLVWNESRNHSCPSTDYLLSTEWEIVPRVKVGWINILQQKGSNCPMPFGSIYDSRGDAIKDRYHHHKYLGEPVFISYEYEVEE